MIKSSESGFTDVAVYDLYGNRMMPFVRFEQTLEIDASSWPSGVYVVKYGSPVLMGKVVKVVKL